MRRRPRGITPRPLTGAALRAERTRLGLSINRLAVRLGVSPSACSRWENEKNPPPPWLDLALRAIEINLIQERQERA